MVQQLAGRESFAGWRWHAEAPTGLASLRAHDLHGN